MKKPPAGWPRISSSIFYRDPAKAIDWLCRAFGFSVRLKVEGEGGRIEHSELEFGEGLIMVGGAGEEYTLPEKALLARTARPAIVGETNTQTLCLYVHHAHTHSARAKASGARLLYKPT